MLVPVLSLYAPLAGKALADWICAQVLKLISLAVPPTI